MGKTDANENIQSTEPCPELHKVGQIQHVNKIMSPIIIL